MVEMRIDPLVARLRDELRTMAMVAGQASIEGTVGALSEADAKFAGYCTKWADELDALLASLPPSVPMALRVGIQNYIAGDADGVGGMRPISPAEREARQQAIVALALPAPPVATTDRST